MNSDLFFAPAHEIAGQLATGRYSAQAITQQLLARIDRYNPALNAINLPTPELALAQAAAADAALSAGQPAGPLHGVPVTNKDAFALQGIPTTAGDPALRNHIPDEDAVVISRLKAAGSVILGQTNVPYMLADHISDNAIYGRSHNPWDRERTPGGSSGGAAAAVAAGLSYLSLGSDIGGSIRIPAHFCGIYGHKPTINLVPLAGHIPPAPWIPPQPKEILPVAGPLARSAEDLRLAMGILGGPAGDDAIAYRWQMPAPRRQNLRDYKIGFVLDDPLCPVSSETGTILQTVVDRLAAAGITLAEGWPDGVDPAAQFYTYRYLLDTVFAFDMQDEMEDYLRQKGQQPGNDSGLILARAWTDPQKKYQRQASQRLVARAAWQRFFGDFDAFLLPTAFQPAFAHTTVPFNQRVHQIDGRERPHEDMLFWISFATLTGLPATTAPAGRTAAGLPVGLQLIGPFLEDATPIDIAARLAELVGGFVPPPGFQD